MRARQGDATPPVGPHAGAVTRIATMLRPLCGNEIVDLSERRRRQKSSATPTSSGCETRPRPTWIPLPAIRPRSSSYRGGAPTITHAVYLGSPGSNQAVCGNAVTAARGPARGVDLFERTPTGPSASAHAATGASGSTGRRAIGQLRKSYRRKTLRRLAGSPMAREFPPVSWEDPFLLC